MDYGQIIKRSWEIVKKNKFLWWLGILAAFAGGFGSPSFNFSGLRGFSSSQSSSSTNPQTTDFTKQFSDFFSSINIPAVITVVVIFIVLMLVVCFVVLYFSLRAKAGLIISVNKIESEGNAIGFRAAMREGKKYFWRLFGLGWLVSLAMFVLILPVIALIFLLIFWHPMAAVVGFGLLILVGFFAIFVLSFLFSIILVFTQIMIVLDNKKVFVSIRDSYELLKRNLKDVIIGYAIMIGVGILIGLVMVISIFVVVALLVLVGIIFAFAGKVAIVVYVLVAVIASIVLLVIATGFVTAFTSTYWTLFYRALKYIDDKKNVGSATKESFVATPGNLINN